MGHDLRPADPPRRIGPEDPALSEVLSLIRTAFAYMDGRVDPPSSMHQMSLPGLRQSAAAAEVWAIGAPVRACVMLTPMTGSLYLGKLAVAPEARGRGLARRLVDLACDRARALGLPAVELQSRIELVENHAVFRRMGFRLVGQTAHPGYGRATSFTFRKDL